MKRWLPLLLILTLVFPTFSRADELDDTTNTLAQKQQQLKDAQAALNQAKTQESQLSGSLGGLQVSLNIAIAEVNVKQAQVDATLAQLDQQTAKLKTEQDARGQRVRSLYKELIQQKSTEFMSLLDAKNLNGLTKILSYQSSALKDDMDRIGSLDTDITQLGQQRDQLQKEAAQLQADKDSLQHQADTIRNQIAIVRSQQQGANNQIVSLGNDIKGLTAKQQQLVQQKLAANAASTTVGDKETISAPMPAPSFANAYAFASYGYPHRVGLSQYGAYARAQAGQDYQTILHAYFANVNIGPGSVPDSISVAGYGTMSMEDQYLLGIHEMPRSWSMEALKTQAILARTYATKWLNDHPGGSICTDENCQVYHNDDPNSQDQYDQRWYQAVRDTRGVIITQNGAPIGAWYSIVAGGYTQTSAQVWGGYTAYTQVTKDYVGSWPSGAYDKISPWFHKVWGSHESSGCDSNTGAGCDPWMTKDQVIDMANAALLYTSTGKTADTDFDLSNPGSGGSTPQQIIDALNKRGVTPIGTFQLVTTGANDSTGQTQSINFIGGPRGSTTMAGADFKKVFNLRSPGTLGLMTSLFDVISQ